MSGVVQGRRNGRRRSVALACAVAVGLVVGACDPGGETTDPETTGEETVTEPATSETSETPSPDVATPPELKQPVPPEEAQVDDRAGAAAAAEHFLRVLEYALATTDVRLLEELSSPECSYCQAQIESIEGRAELGQWTVTDPATLSDVRVQYLTDSQQGYLVRFVMDSPAGTVMSADGVVEEWPAETFPSFAIAVQWVGDGFQILGVDSDTGA